MATNTLKNAIRVRQRNTVRNAHLGRGNKEIEASTVVVYSCVCPHIDDKNWPMRAREFLQLS